MALLGKIKLTGRSGQQYRFRVFPLGTRFRKLSGVYVIANRSRRATGELRHTVVYVGNTEDFSQPFAAHRKANEFAQALREPIASACSRMNRKTLVGRRNGT